MIKYNDKPVAIYNGDYKPMNEYRNGVKVSGYKEVTLEGKTITADGTYNDALDLTVQGHHTQNSENAIFWNQVIIDPNFSNPYGVSWESASNYGSTVDISENIITIVSNNSRGPYAYSAKAFYPIAGHKYLFIAHVKSSVSGYFRFTGHYIDISSSSNNIPINYNQWQVLMSVLQQPDVSNLRVRYGITLIGKEGEERILQCKYYNVFDLTAMFGAGHEPTAEEFRKMFPCDYYPYNEGEWMYAPKGQWVRFNQLCNVKSGIYSWRGVNYQNLEDGSVKVWTDEGGATNTSHYDWYNGSGPYKNKIGIKLFLSGCPNTKFAEKVRFYEMQGNNYGSYNGESSISTINRNSGETLCIMVLGGVEIKEEEALIFKPQCVNLTEMFGEGNEPATVEEFKALYPEEYYEYTEGRYEDTGGFVVDGEIVPNDVNTSFSSPMPDLPEEIKVLQNPKVSVDCLPRLPKEYQEVEYIESDGEQYINSEYIANDSTEFYCNLLFNDLSVSQGLFGSINTVGVAGADSCNVFFVSSSQKLRPDWIYGNSNYISKIIEIEKVYKIHVKNDSIIIDGYPYNAAKHSIKNQLYYFYIFNFANGSASPYSKGLIGRMYNAEIHEANSVIRKFVPCYRKSDHVAGMFDLVSKRFFTNQGTGEFICGNDVDTITYANGFQKTEHVLPFTLYGANGVFDTVEPNVLVDGVRKCRVTRRWGKVDMGTLRWILHSQDETNNLVKYRAQPTGIKYYTKVTEPSIPPLLCTAFRSVRMAYFDTNASVINIIRGDDDRVQRVWVRTYLDKYPSADDFKAAMIGEYLYVELAEPIIELYEPIDIKTLPINTIVLNDQDCEMSANIKVIDN